MRIGKYNIDITNEDKVLFPEDGYTKCDLIEYYREISSYMIPLIKDRPLSMLRYPDGIYGEKFFQKKISKYFPSWIKTISVERKEKDSIDMVLCNNAATLVYLANQACITPHIWLSKKNKVNSPDRLIFDLDPPEGKFKLVKEGAASIKNIAEEKLGLKTFLMTTGSKGMHVVIPIKSDNDFKTVKAFAKAIGSLLSLEVPDKFTIEHRIEKRKGRLFIDYLRNEYAQTGVAPYAVRARSGAPVATPLSWEEINEKDLSSSKYNIGNIFDRLKSIEDPWKDINSYSASINTAIKKLEKIIPAGNSLKNG